MYPFPEVNHSWVPQIGHHLLYRRVGELMIPVNLDTAQTILEKAFGKSGSKVDSDPPSDSSGAETE
jgi:hypothetical protein